VKDVCPTTGKRFEDCGACTGEVCWLCGAGLFQTGQGVDREGNVIPCEHDVLDRHEGFDGQAAT
jgi:hypothetical protein